MSTSILERIRAEVSALEIAHGEGIDTIRKGSSESCYCPFHKEDSPSLSFYQGGFRWTCFGCKASGDAITFYAKRHGLESKKDFPKVIKEIAFQYLGEDILNTNEYDSAKPFDYRTLWPYNKPGVKVYTFPEGDYCKYGEGPMDKCVIIHVIDPPSIRYGYTEGEYYFSAGAWRKIGTGKGKKTPPKLAPTRKFEAVPFTLYRPEVWADVSESDWIYLCEGPSDADACIQHLGLPATTPTGGASGLAERHVEQLRGKRVVIITDADEAGRDGLVRRRKLLRGVAKEIKCLPELGTKKGYDLRNWIEDRIEQGMPTDEIRGEFLAIVDAATDGIPKSQGKKKRQTKADKNDGDSDGNSSSGSKRAPMGDRRLTDVANAERLAEEYEDRLIHCEGLSPAWHTWNCCRYVPATRHEEIDLARQRVDKILADEVAMAEANETQEYTEALRSFGLQSLNAARLNAMLSIAKGHPRIAVDPIEMDSNPFEINTPQGVYDLMQHRIIPHELYRQQSKAPLRFMKSTGADFDPDAKCENWEKFLRSIIVDPEGEVDEETIAFIQRVCGYLLTGSVKEKCLFILWGDGDNGKGFFVSALTKVLADYCKEIDFRALLQLRTEQDANPYVASLCGVRAAWAAEAPESSKWNEGVLKRVVGGGGDRLTARFLHGNPIQFDLTAKLILQTNHRPMAYDRSSGFWGRIRLIKLRRRFVKDWHKEDPLTGKPDPDLLDRLHAESSGILNWMIEGCKMWQRDGLGTSEAIEDEVRKYRIEEDPTADFIEENMVLELGAKITSRRLSEIYYKYCEEEHIKPLSSQRFAKCIKSLEGVTKGKIGAGGCDGNGYFGIRERTIIEKEYQNLGSSTSEDSETSEGSTQGQPRISDAPPF